MKTAVIYFTKTGHSKRIADAVAEALNVKSANISEDPDLTEVDLLFIVGGIYGSKSDPKMIGYVSKIDGKMVRKAALVTSCASNRRKQDMVRETLTKNGIEVIPDEFVCKGRFLFLRPGHPDKTDISNAAAFAKKHAGIGG